MQTNDSCSLYQPAHYGLMVLWVVLFGLLLLESLVVRLRRLDPAPVRSFPFGCCGCSLDTCVRGCQIDIWCVYLALLVFLIALPAYVLAVPDASVSVLSQSAVILVLMSLRFALMAELNLMSARIGVFVCCTFVWLTADCLRHVHRR